MTLLIYRITSVLRGRRGILLLCVLGAILLILVLYLASRSSSRFAEEYAHYVVLAKEQEAAAYLPGSKDNEIRQQLNLDLALSLDQKTKTTERLTYATDGLELINKLNAQIDAIGDAGQKVDVLIAQMQIDSLKDFAASGETRELIGLAKQRSAIIEDIRGLSYRANFETKQIFEQILQDKGELTAGYVTELNDKIPAVEAQFDHRSSLYEQLQSVSSKIDEKATALHISRPTE